ncbi:MAG: endonuclease domain-containing protein [Clostridia bacterium]|nr:endonuclease domain-containing protein [Clostridia bacterium]
MRARNNALMENARKLRKAMTKEERHLWYDFLRLYPVRFRRQEILGNYIADFFCSSARIVIELDGSQHYGAEGEMRDKKRTADLNAMGYEVIRFSNLDVMRNFDGVCSEIDSIIRKKIKTRR